MKKTSDQEALLKLGIPVTILEERWIREMSFFFLAYSLDMTAFNKRMDTPESKLMHNSEKWWDFK